MFTDRRFEITVLRSLQGRLRKRPRLLSPDLSTTNGMGAYEEHEEPRQLNPHVLRVSDVRQ